MNCGTSIRAAGAAMVMLGVVACGGAGGSPTPAASRPTHLYAVSLSASGERHGGAAQGRGDAIIAFHGPTRLCWRFAHLHGFTTATRAAIFAGATGRSGPAVIALTGPPLLHHRGCTATSSATGTRVAGDPAAYYVNIFSARYPVGAVRGQL